MDRYCGQAPARQAGLMVDSFKIKNFRGFDDVAVEDCRQINVIVGDNGSGKTAMLEALFLAAGVSPELILRTGRWRGQEMDRLHGNAEDLQLALWGDLFFRFQTNRYAVISLKGEGEQQREVQVRLNPRGKMRVIPPPRDRSGAPVKLVPERNPIEFRWDIRGMAPFTIAPRFENERLTIPQSPARAVKAAFYAATRVPGSTETATRFSAMSQQFEVDQFVKDFCALYPVVNDISVELSGGMSSLYGAVAGIPRKLPLSVVSGGMNKLAAILLAIADQEGGLILIDEIENGFYHKKLAEIWRVIIAYSRRYRCQVFASTHSDECLHAIAAYAKESPEDFCLIRTVRTPADGSKVRQYEGSLFADAVLDNVEVR